MEEDRGAILELFSSRVGTYALLARLYRSEVDQPLLDELDAMHYPTNTGNADVDAGYRKIATYLSTSHIDTITELAIDYVNTFIGHGIDGHSAAYPFESVYTSPRRLLMQGARDDVLVIYRANGMDKNEHWKDGEDHIALELEFMQVMAQRTLDIYRTDGEPAIQDLLETQHRFLDDHLFAWFPMMAADMRKFAQTMFYQGLCDLTYGFLSTDREFLKEALAPGEEAAAPVEAVEPKAGVANTPAEAEPAAEGE